MSQINMVEHRMVDWKLPDTVAYCWVWNKTTDKTKSDLEYEVEEGLLHEPGVEPEVLHGEFTEVEPYILLMQEYPYSRRQQLFFSPWVNDNLIRSVTYKIYVPSENEHGETVVCKKLISNVWHPQLSSQAAEALDCVALQIMLSTAEFDAAGPAPEQEESDDDTNESVYSDLEEDNWSDVPYSDDDEEYFQVSDGDEEIDR